MAAPPAPPLAQVQAALDRSAPQLIALPHVADRVSGFVDDSQRVSPKHAAASGSLRLFQRVASRLFDGSVDPIEREYALAQALEAAIRNDDLAMVQAIHALHPQPLDAQSLPLAMAHGSLELVQWVINERHDRVCCGSGIANLCVGCVESAGQSIGDKDTFRIATWLVGERVLSISDGSESSNGLGLRTAMSGGLTKAAGAALRKSAELVRWCDTRGLLTDRMAVSLMRDALRHANAASYEIVRYLLERGCVFENEMELVDLLIEASCHPNQEALVELVLSSAAFSAVRHHFVYAPTDASGTGVKVLQWDREYENKRKETSFFGMAMVTSIAGAKGHLATMQWLAEARGVTMLKSPHSGVTEEESLKIIQWLHGTGVGRWDTDTMDTAAFNGHLQVVQWLHNNRSEGCSKNAMDRAAANGHLKVVQWLHENRSEGCTEGAMNLAAGRGHLAVVQFLYENRSECQVSKAMAFAVTSGQLDVVRWCFEHGGCGRCVQREVLLQPATYSANRLDNLYARPLYTLQWLAAHAHGSAATAPGCTGQCVPGLVQYEPFNLAVVALSWGDRLLAEYLHQYHSELFAWTEAQATVIMSAIVWQGHLPAIQWLHARQPGRFDWQRLADIATQRQQPHVAEWLREVNS